MSIAYTVPGFCTFCDADATHFLPSDPIVDGEPYRFCDTCFDCFQLGQNHANETAKNYDTTEDPFHQDYSGEKWVRLICDNCKELTLLPYTELLIDVMSRCENCEEGYLFTEKEKEETE